MIYKRDIQLMKEKIIMFIAGKLPRNIAYWAAIRVIANATQGPYSNTVVPELTAMEALKRWQGS